MREKEIRAELVGRMEEAIRETRNYIYSVRRFLDGKGDEAGMPVNPVVIQCFTLANLEEEMKWRRVK